MSKIPYSLTEARASLTTNAVFFAIIMYREANIRIIAKDDKAGGARVPTACTDGRNITFNMNFFEDTLTKLSERVFVIAHEVYHLMGGHAQKMVKYAMSGLFGRPFYPVLMNWCMDAVINQTLIESRIGTMPESGGVLHPDVKSTDLIEDVYERFLKLIPEEADSDDYSLGGSPTDEDGEGGSSGDDEDGETEGDKDLGGGKSGEDMGFTGKPNDELEAPAEDAPSDQTLKLAISAAVTAQKVDGGTMPAGLKSYIDDLLDPQIDWREEFRDFFVTTLGKDLSTWSRPNKRRLVLPGIYLPKKIGFRCGPFVGGFDTSGSMSDLEIAAVLTEQCAVLSDVRPTSCHIVWCDAQVERVDEIEDAGELLELTRAEGIPGRGGTMFDPVFEWVEENLEEPPCVLVYGTDGYPAKWPDESICDYPVIWLMTTDVIAPWGITIRIHV
jgi:predicted metal-dependent peptidase